MPSSRKLFRVPRVPLATKLFWPPVLLPPLLPLVPELVRDHAGAQSGKLDVVAPVERQLCDLCCRDHLSERGCFGLNRWRFGGYDDVFGNRANGHIKIDAQAVLHFDRDGVASLRFEALRFRYHFVSARTQRRRDKVSGAIGLRLCESRWYRFQLR